MFKDLLSSECLQENGHVSLKVLTLHEMGNFHFYTENMRLEMNFICFHICVCAAVSGNKKGIN